MSATLTGAPHGQTETGAVYAEAYAPARLLGIAQRAMKNALLCRDADEMKALLSRALERVTQPEDLA